MFYGYNSSAGGDIYHQMDIEAWAGVLAEMVVEPGEDISVVLLNFCLIKVARR